MSARSIERLRQSADDDFRGDEYQEQSGKGEIDSGGDADSDPPGEQNGDPSAQPQQHEQGEWHALQWHSSRPIGYRRQQKASDDRPAIAERQFMCVSNIQGKRRGRLDPAREKGDGCRNDRESPNRRKQKERAKSRGQHVRATLRAIAGNRGHGSPRLEYGFTAQHSYAPLPEMSRMPSEFWLIR